MKIIKYFVIVSLFILIFTFFNSNKNNVLQTDKQISIKDIKNSNNKEYNFKKSFEEGLNKLSIEIALLSNDALLSSWSYEYGCSYKKTCDNYMQSAKSYEEAIWMRDNGYLSQSLLDALNSLSISDLSKLANKGNVNAKKLMSINLLRQKKNKQAKLFASSAIANSNASETFGYRLLANTYLSSSQPMLAIVELKIASILGDYEATKEYEKLMINRPIMYIDNTNKIAYGYLSSMLHAPMHTWGDNPRPKGNGGG